MDPEKEAFDAYKEAGVELPPEAEPKPLEEPPVVVPEVIPEPVVVVETKVEVDVEPPLIPEPQAVPKKRSIYQSLKDTRQDVKTERELRESAERERDELRAKLDVPAKATDDDDLEAFAKEIDADPATLKRMQAVFLKNAPKSEFSEEQSTQLKEFQDWQKTNSEAVSQVQFDKEFENALPTLGRLFPNASPEETKVLKAALDKLAHSDAYHDKEIDYIAFKNQDTLKALVSPQKRGLESKGRLDAPTVTTFEFNPNADLSKMSDKESEAWQKEYQKATSSDSLHTDAEGRRILI